MKKAQSRLATLEAWMQDVIQCPKGAARGIKSASKKQGRSDFPKNARTLKSLILPSSSRTSLERFETYTDMYWLRLVDCLADDFAALKHAMGTNRFNALARAFVARHPSTHFSLNVLGVRFPDFVGKHATPKSQRTFFHELALLERFIQQVFDAETGHPVSPRKVKQASGEKFVQARFVMIPAFQLLATSFPVNVYFQRVKDGKRASIPKRKPSYVVIYRKDDSVWRQDLSLERWTLLNALQSGLTLKSALNRCLKLEGIDPSELLSNLRDWFHRWTAEGFFQDIKIG